MPAEFDPPPHLSPRAADLWRAVVPSRAKSAERLAIITEALTALDRADAAAAQVNSDGMATVTASTKAIHAHPLLKVERESRQMFLKAWRDLGFATSPSIDPKWNEYAREYK